MKLILFTMCLSLSLVACRPAENTPAETQNNQPLLVAPNLAVSAASTPPPQAVSSPIVAQILDTPQEADIIQSSKQAMHNVSASDVAAAASQSQTAALQAAPPVQTPQFEPENLPKVKLPDLCEKYYKRVDACFAKQKDFSEELRMMNQDARIDLAADKPTDQTCIALDKSFDGVARNLGCE